MISKDDQLLPLVGARLKALRKQHRLSVNEVEASTGITLADIEAGEKDVKVDVLAVLCEYYRTSLFDFFREIEKPMFDSE